MIKLGIKDKVRNKKMIKFIIIMVFSIIAMPLQAELNDTGITKCGNASSNTETCPESNYDKQDAEYGRDVTNNDSRDGHAGFSYTKINMAGDELDADAEIWACVQDNVTGLMWEVKTDDDGLQDRDWTYSWYNSDSGSNVGHPGTSNAGVCDSDTSSECNTERYVSRVNNISISLCGHRDWRLPYKHELVSLRILDGTHHPTIDNTYFPHSIDSRYWSVSPYAPDLNSAWGISFDSGDVFYDSKSTANPVRLVR